jgi:hypothetical protein
MHISSLPLIRLTPHIVKQFAVKQWYLEKGAFRAALVLGAHAGSTCRIAYGIRQSTRDGNSLAVILHG